MSCVPIQEIQDTAVYGILISVSLILIWYFPIGLALTIPITIYYFLHMPRISDSAFGFIAYQSRWEQWNGKKWQQRLSR